MGINEYVEQRLKHQQQWYEEHASTNKRMFMRYQAVIIVLGALIPVVVVLGETYTMTNISGPLSAAISAVISILAGIDKLQQPQTNWFNYRSNEEALKKEQWMYLFNAGPYDGLARIDADRLLVERVESIISADIARFTKADREAAEARDLEGALEKPAEESNGEPPASPASGS